MSYTIDYSALSGAEKRAKAFQDALERWGSFGEKALETVRQAIRDGASDAAIVFALSFSGVQGYPATAVIETLREELGIPAPSAEETPECEQS